MKAPLLAALLLGAALLPSSASAARTHYLDSPEVRPAPPGELSEKKFYWDDATHRFGVALTYKAPGRPPQTLHFPFPRVRHEDGTGRFVLDLGTGKPATVAHTFFFGRVYLADRNRLAVQTRHGVVRVTLDVEE